MANWHVRALMERREEYESERYSKDFDLAMAIAVHIGKDDSPAVMSIRRIAELAGCSYNLADIRTKALAKAGKLVIGPSETRLLAYNLPFQAEREPDDEPPPSPGRADAPQSLYAEVGELREMVGVLAQTVKDLHAVISQSIPTNVPMPSHSHPNDFPMDQREIGNEVGKKESREEEREARAERQEDDYWALPAELADSPEFAQKWRDWLVYTQQAGITFTPRQAVVNLQRFREWGVDKAILALETALLKGWKNIYEPEAETAKTPSANGRPPDAVWDAVMEQLRAGRWQLPRDGPETRALNKIGGWSVLRNATEREIGFIKQRYLDAYANLH